MILNNTNTKHVRGIYYRTTVTTKNCMSLVKGLMKLKIWYVIERGRNTVLWQGKSKAKRLQLKDLVA
jgi:hypothetical protein